MIHTMIDEYRSCLNRYIESENCLYKLQAELLIIKLKSVQSIEEFLEVLSHASESNIYNPANPSFFIVSGDPFLTKIDETIQKVTQLQTIDTKIICSSFKNISTDIRTEALIGLLKMVLEDPRSLLHRKTKDLLLMLQDLNMLQNIVDHLAKQDPKPRPLNPRQGSFDAIKPLNAQQDACLGLLRSNSGSFNSTNPDSEAANNLLQALLIIYQDVNSPDPVPEKPSPQEINSPAPVPEKPSCTIL